MTRKENYDELLIAGANVANALDSKANKSEVDTLSNALDGKANDPHGDEAHSETYATTSQIDSKADQDGGGTATLDDYAAINTEQLNAGQLNGIEILGGPGHTSLSDALAALPAEGGTINLVETVTETADVTISKPVQIIGSGFPYSQNASAYIDMGGNTLHATERAQTWEKLQVVNGNVIIGEHDSYGGRHHIELGVRNSPGDSIEFRGGFMDCHFDIKSNHSNGRGVVWNLDGDGLDYFNQNSVFLTVHSATDDSVVVTGFGSGTSEFHGNDFFRFLAEGGSGAGFIVDDSITLRSNKFFGYGVHDGGVDIQPSSFTGNIIWWSELRGGGVVNIGGEVHARDPGYLRDITTDINTKIRLSGLTNFMEPGGDTRTELWDHPDYGQITETVNGLQVGTSPVSLGTVERSASLTIHGENASEGIVSFIDRVDVIAFGSANVVSETERNGPASRTYNATSDGDIEISMSSGTYEIHVEKLLSGQK